MKVVESLMGYDLSPLSRITRVPVGLHVEGSFLAEYLFVAQIKSYYDAPHSCPCSYHTRLTLKGIVMPSMQTTIGLSMDVWFMPLDNCVVTPREFKEKFRIMTESTA